MSLEKEIKDWQQSKHLVYKMGLKEDAKVVDFGSGKGRYTIALAYALTKGKVYALDTSKYALNELKMDSKGLNNIEIIHTNSKGILPFEDESIDCILIYDLIHQISDIRETFIKESYRVLKKDGILSVLPFHLSMKQYQNICHEIENHGFVLDQVLLNEGYHFEMHEWLYGNKGCLKDIEKGTIYNYKK